MALKYGNTGTDPFGVRFFLILLLLSFLQSSRLEASPAGMEECLEYIAAEGVRLFYWVIGAEEFINHRSLLNAAQTIPHAAEERISSETMNQVSSTERKYSVNPSEKCARESTNHQSDSSNLNQCIDLPTAYSLQPIASIRPVGRIVTTELSGQATSQVSNLGSHILGLPSGLIFQFLRSPEVKQAVYKAEHQQTIQELQEKYPNLADKIAIWKRVVEEWNGCFTLEKKETRYQQLKVLASTMNSQLYHLVALSQAMNIIEDAIAYTHYLPRAWEKYDQNLNTEEEKIATAMAKTILLAQIDAINNNILDLEQAAEAILILSEQKNRCLAAAAGVTAAEDVNIIAKLQTAAKIVGESIAFYCQFGQKMRGGDASAASLILMKALSSEYNALEQEWFYELLSGNEVRIPLKSLRDSIID